MSMVLPNASKKVLIGCPDYQKLLDGVQIINFELTRKDDDALTSKSKINI